jgi:hypothetical protein
MRIVEDLIPPAVVAAADIVTAQKWPKYNEFVGYGLAVIGQFAEYIPMVPRSPWVKNMGIAATPWALKSLYTRIKAMTGATGTSRLGRYPSTPTTPEFSAVRLV